MIAALAHLTRLARAGFVFAREGVFALVDPARLPLPARAALRIARLIERPAQPVAANRLAAALTRLGPTYVKLGQFMATRPDVVGVVLARDLETLQDKMAPFPQAEAERTVAAALGKPLVRAVRVVRSAGRGRLDRAGPPCRDRDRRRAARHGGEGAAPRHRAALQGATWSRSRSPRATPRDSPPKRGACA